MTKPTIPTSGLASPLPGHLQPPKPPEVQPFPAKPHLASQAEPILLCPTLPLPELLQPLAGVHHLVVTSHVDKVDEGEEIPNFGHEFMAMGDSFGKITSNEMIQARKHLLDVEHELLKSNLPWKIREGIHDDVASSLEPSDVASSFEPSDDDMIEEEGEVEEVECKQEHEAFRKLMNRALKAMREEQEEINEVDALLGEVERERLRKGKEVVLENFPVTGNTIPTIVPPPLAPPPLAGNGASPMAKAPLVLEGKPNSKAMTHSRAPITSITPIPSPFPPISSNSNLPPFSSSSLPPLFY